MDLDNITIGDARRLAAMFGTAAAPAQSLASRFVGRWVVVRSSQSGVWLGRLVASDGADVVLADARRAWSWKGAASCSGLAITGPTGGQIAAPVSEAVVFGACEILAATEDAVASWSKVEPWVAR